MCLNVCPDKIYLDVRAHCIFIHMNMQNQPLLLLITQISKGNKTEQKQKKKRMWHVY